MQLLHGRTLRLDVIAHDLKVMGTHARRSLPMHPFLSGLGNSTRVKASPRDYARGDTRDKGPSPAPPTARSLQPCLPGGGAEFLRSTEKVEMRLSKSLAVAAGVLVLSLGVVACGDSPTSTPPGVEPQVTNNTDAFAYQLSDLDGATGSYDYTWQNTGTLANVTHASDAGDTGSATVSIRDADGTEVYAGLFASSGEVTSSPTGTPGPWTIRVTYANYSNTQVNFAVIKQ